MWAGFIPWAGLSGWQSLLARFRGAKLCFKSQKQYSADLAAVFCGRSCSECFGNLKNKFQAAQTAFGVKTQKLQHWLDPNKQTVFGCEQTIRQEPAQAAGNP